MQIKIKNVLLNKIIRKCEETTVELKQRDLISSEIVYGSEYFELNVPFDNVKEVSLYWETTDPDEKAKIKIDYVFLRLHKLVYSQKYYCQQIMVYVSDKEISSKETVPLV